jgi:hypothetical protein
VEKEAKDELERTIGSLCKWIRERCEKGLTGEELNVLPGVIQATANLLAVSPFSRYTATGSTKANQ